MTDGERRQPESEAEYARFDQIGGTGDGDLERDISSGEGTGEVSPAGAGVSEIDRAIDELIADGTLAEDADGKIRFADQPSEPRGKTCTAHQFYDSGEAYDACQCDDDIADGDILVIARERVIGVLVEAWPVAITKERGKFHRLEDTRSWDEFEGGKYAESVRKARQLARTMFGEEGQDGR